jgi:hypothetical protein
MATGMLDAGGDFLGDFVELTGTLISKEFGGFNAGYLIDDGTGPVLVFVDGTTGIDQSRVDGFLGRYVRIRGSTKCFRGTKEIQPRFDADIEGLGVPMDIKPGSCDNPLSVNAQGLLPVVIPGTADLDVSMIDASTLLLEGVPVKKAVVAHVPDITGSACDDDCMPWPEDEYPDLDMKFSASDVLEAIGPVESHNLTFPLRLTGYMLDGTPFDAVDCIIVRAGFLADDDPPAGGLGDQPIFEPLTGPTAPVQTVSYSVPTEVTVKISVFSITGRLVEQLVNRVESSGSHAVSWDAARYPSGVYFYRFEAGDYVETKKVMLVH